MRILNRIFEKKLGQVRIKASLIMRLKNPKKTTPFETSLLKDDCWRTDIFPEKSPRFRLNLKFCTPSNEKSQIVRFYTYILDVKELGAKNSE